MINDPIADFIVRLQNGSAARRASVTVGFSNLNMVLAEKLAAAGFIKGAVKKGKKTKKVIEIELAYRGREPRLAGVRRVSKLSRRVYLGARSLRPFRQGYGEYLISTSRGVMTGAEARAAKVGGEVLFAIW